jgi:uncharacterized protein (DUF433 family)
VEVLLSRDEVGGAVLKLKGHSAHTLASAKAAADLILGTMEKLGWKEEQHMAPLDWSKCPAVESVPGKLSGAWVFRDTRMPVSIVFENLEAGAMIDEIMDWFHLTREQIIAVLEFAARSLDPSPPPITTSSSSNAHPA